MTNQGDGSGHKCTCDLCVKWFPLFERIKARITPADAELFDEWIAKCEGDSTDAGAMSAMLAGEWPGWEWMKEARVQHGFKA